MTVVLSALSTTAASPTGGARSERLRHRRDAGTPPVSAGPRRTWSSGGAARDLTDEGLSWPGPVVDQALNCTTGQLTLQVVGLADIQFRPPSDRAKVVHQPQLARRGQGFDTSQWDAIDDRRGLYPGL